MSNDASGALPVMTVATMEDEEVDILPLSSSSLVLSELKSWSSRERTAIRGDGSDGIRDGMILPTDATTIDSGSGDDLEDPDPLVLWEGVEIAKTTGEP